MPNSKQQPSFRGGGSSSSNSEFLQKWTTDEETTTTTTTNNLESSNKLSNTLNSSLPLHKEASVHFADEVNILEAKTTTTCVRILHPPPPLPPQDLNESSRDSIHILNGLESLQIESYALHNCNIIKYKNDLNLCFGVFFRTNDEISKSLVKSKEPEIGNVNESCKIQCIHCNLQSSDHVDHHDEFMADPSSSSPRPISPPAPSIAYVNHSLVQSQSQIKNMMNRPGTAAAAAHHHRRQFVYKSPNKKIPIQTSKGPRQFIKLQDCTTWLTITSSNQTNGPVTRLSGHQSANLENNFSYFSNSPKSANPSATSFRYFTSNGSNNVVDANLNRITMLLNKRSTRVNT